MIAKLSEFRLKPGMTVLCALLLFGPALVACEEEGPAEEAGEALDQAVEEAGDKLEEAGDELERKTD